MRLARADSKLQHAEHRIVCDEVDAQLLDTAPAAAEISQKSCPASSRRGHVLKRAESPKIGAGTEVPVSLMLK